MSFTVSKLAQRAAVGIETIRFYERKGLLDPAPRTASGYRIYSENSVMRIRFIRRAQALGFTLNEIAELIDIESDAAASCHSVRDRAEAKVVAIEQRIADLERMKGGLQSLLDTCDGEKSIGECPIISCLEISC